VASRQARHELSVVDAFTAIVPPAPDGVIGPYDVVVSDAGGTSPTTIADVFTYF
jgi:hypothetical protein